MKIIKGTAGLSEEQIVKIHESFNNDINTLDPQAFKDKYADIEIPEVCITRPIRERGIDFSLLHCLADSGNKKHILENIVTVVLQCKADGINVDIKFRGITPLHKAVRANNVNAVLFLIDAGANPNAENDEGNTPLFYAFNTTYDPFKSQNRFHQENMAGYLIKLGAKITPELKERLKYNEVFTAMMTENQDKEIESLKNDIKTLTAKIDLLMKSNEKQLETTAPVVRNNFFGK